MYEVMQCIAFLGYVGQIEGPSSPFANWKKEEKNAAIANFANARGMLLLSRSKSSLSIVEHSMTWDKDAMGEIQNSKDDDVST